MLFGTKLDKWLEVPGSPEPLIFVILDLQKVFLPC